MAPESRPEIALQNPRRFRSLEPERTENWLRDLLASVAPHAKSFTVRFVGDAEILDLNRRYRGRKRPTDILSFPGGESPEGFHLGDVVISIPTARRQAAFRGVSDQCELRALLLHGVLHCLGFDHEVDDGQMNRMERRLQRRWLGDAD